MQIDEIRENILNARERRAALRGQCAQQGNACLSLTLNVPGYPKSSPLLSAFFDAALPDLKRHLRAHRVAIDVGRELRQVDEAGDFYLVPLRDGRPLSDTKALCEAFEEGHPLGRLLDVDIADGRLQPVSSQKIKRCLLCEQPALVCMREGAHALAELRAHLLARIERYLSDRDRRRVCRRLAELALKAILYEITVSPKPGLVDRFEQGAHRDMDYFTFLDSTAAIAARFEELAAMGWSYPGGDRRAGLPLLRTVGIEMEEAMFAATNGVNTQKGLIFLMGLALFATARVIARDGAFHEDSCREEIAAVCRGLVRDELAAAPKEEATHGAACFRRYGEEYGGVRREAEKGLPSVFDHGLPELKAALAGAGDPVAAPRLNEALTRTLLRLMSVVDDTNILHRRDIATLKAVQELARQVLAAGSGKEETERYGRLIDYCRREFVSPGGSADLLAVTMFFFFAGRDFSAHAGKRNPS
ncbi:MAG TPA: triphosphoribosyl-dephospho-CoA synthase [Syntrophales bacterium]|nr:triphosphoribosyl-dephospho-CoA synthase [Syntrophales bacterium]